MTFTAIPEDQSRRAKMGKEGVLEKYKEVALVSLSSMITVM